jgi:membrane protease YdiL (CAAX protease family)
MDLAIVKRPKLCEPNQGLGYMLKKFSTNNLARGSLLFLLILRFLISYSISRSGKFELPSWEDDAFLCASYVLISLLLWINKADLHEINVDKNFVILFVILGAIYTFLTPTVIGILMGAATILNKRVAFWQSSMKMRFHQCFIFSFLDSIYFFAIQKARFSMGGLNFIDAIFWTNPPMIAVEEFLFRGLLWKLLRDFEYTENKIIYIQAFLFWICHFYLEPIIFWIFLPLISILLGYLVSRTKTISSSMFLHFLHNIFSFIFPLLNLGILCFILQCEVSQPTSLILFTDHPPDHPQVEIFQRKNG